MQLRPHYSSSFDETNIKSIKDEWLPDKSAIASFKNHKKSALLSVVIIITASIIRLHCKLCLFH